ncbi:hypothetical protein A6R68_01219, partial [Neotoma lepida]
VMLPQPCAAAPEPTARNPRAPLGPTIAASMGRGLTAGLPASQQQHHRSKGCCFPDPIPIPALATSNIQRPPGSLLDKPIPLPPAIKAEKGGSSIWNAEEQNPKPSLPSLELQPLVGSGRAATIQKPLRIVYSTLGTPHSIESLKKSTQHFKPEACSISTLLSSGYAADEESSKASLDNSKRIVRLTKHLTTQVDSTQSSELGITSSPSASKTRRLNSQGQHTQQAGGEK